MENDDCVIDYLLQQDRSVGVSGFERVYVHSEGGRKVYREIHDVNHNRLGLYTFDNPDMMLRYFNKVNY